MVSISEIILALGGLTRVARHFDCPVTTVQKWRDSGRIPPERWLSLIEMASSLGRDDITSDLLVRLHAPQPPAPAPSPEEAA